MLIDPERTRYDLNFRCLGFPVRVSPYFWLGTVLLGANLAQLGLHVLLIWVGCVFLAILVHELGHALAYRWFGTGAHIVLVMFGGLAVGWDMLRGWWRRVLVSLAGPGAGFVFLAVVWGSNKLWPWAATSPYAFLVYYFLYSINLYWGILNLFPVWPLDGGKVCRELCVLASPRRGVRVSLEISIAVAGLLCLYSLATINGIDTRVPDWLRLWLPSGSIFSAIFFGLMAYESWRLIREEEWASSHRDDDRPPWRR